MTFAPVIRGPVALYNNLPIAPQNYNPSAFPITALTYGQTTIVTMGNGTNNVSPNYVIGQLIRLNIPGPYGATQLNQQTGYVLSVLSTDQVEVSINSLNADAFVPNPTYIGQQSQTVAQIVAIGDINSGTTNRGRTNNLSSIPGSFINVSP
jgi:hypothetical protein